MKKIYSLLLLGLVVAMAGCRDERDMELPEIITEDIVAAPSECDAYRRGDTISFCYRFRDNEELGKFNLEIHSNHDHHTHSTSAVDCELDPEHEPISPWVYNQDFDIAPGTSDYTAHVDIVVPEGVDLGDYHFMIRLTDQAGWQQLRSIAIKIR